MTGALLWFRRDLRLADHPAMDAACRAGKWVLPVFVWDQKAEGDWPLGSASLVWLYHSLRQLQDALKRRGGNLLIFAGDTEAILAQLAAHTGATLHANRRIEPSARQLEAALDRRFSKEGRDIRWFQAGLLMDPAAFLNRQGKPYQVYTPFAKALALAQDLPAPLPAPARIPAPADLTRLLPEGLCPVEVDDLGLLPPAPCWDRDMMGHWQDEGGVGEAAAWRRLEAFGEDSLARYAEGRDRPDTPGTSRLSPHLCFGEITPAQVWTHLLAAWDARRPGPGRHHEALTGYLKQIVWREFAQYLLFHFPHGVDRPLKPRFDHFPWREDPAALAAWRQGRTGYPLVDAGMRELWATGWMHNRVRMVVASFLVKHLMLPWQSGARWFWDTLVDADLGNNTLGWQWTAGCGADAAPYFRVFNPMLQGTRFDPEGAYVRRWVPELAEVSSRWIHQPWRMPSAAQMPLGSDDYPAPIVDHDQARRRALAAYQATRPAASKGARR